MTKEILKRVGLCAPKWMDAMYCSGKDDSDPGHVEFKSFECYLGHYIDPYSTLACFAMREAIRREGKSWSLACEHLGSGVRYGMHLEDWFSGWRNDSETLATVNAFLKVFEKEEA